MSKEITWQDVAEFFEKECAKNREFVDVYVVRDNTIHKGKLALEEEEYGLFYPDDKEFGGFRYGFGERSPRTAFRTLEEAKAELKVQFIWEYMNDGYDNTVSLIADDVNQIYDILKNMTHLSKKN